MGNISTQITQDIVILTVLKLASSAVALASTAWCMVRTITTVDADGTKRLTPAGHVAVALAVGSFLVACSMQGFETMSKISERHSGEIKAANEAARQAAQESHQFRVEAMEREQTAIQRLARAETLAGQAEQRSARAEARLLTLTAAEAARQRDLAIAKDVNRGTHANLVRTGAAIVQLDRILHPVERLEIVIRFELPLGPEMQDLRTAARTIDAADPATWPDWLHGAALEGDSKILEIKPESPYYPMPERYPEVAAAIFSATAQIGFFAPAYPRSAINPMNIPESDLYLRAVAAAAPVLKYRVESHSLLLEMATGANPELRRTARIMSSDDLHSSLLGIFVETRPNRTGRIRLSTDRLKALMKGMTPTSVDLKYSGRSQYFAYDQIRQNGDLFGRPMFLIDVNQH